MERSQMADKWVLAGEISAWARASVATLRSDPELAEKQAKMAISLQKKARLKKPYELKLLFCRRCKRFSPPSERSTTRLRNGYIVRRCAECGAASRTGYVRQRDKA